MRCPECNLDMVSQNVTHEHPYNFDMSGLSNVLLSGITLFRCTKCNFDMPSIPKIAELHNGIARYLINKDTQLSGEEIKFIRKQLGFSQNEFAEMMEITEEKLDEIEKTLKGKEDAPMRVTFFMDQWVWK